MNVETARKSVGSEVLYIPDHDKSPRLRKIVNVIRSCHKNKTLAVCTAPNKDHVYFINVGQLVPMFHKDLPKIEKATDDLPIRKIITLTVFFFAVNLGFVFLSQWYSYFGFMLSLIVITLFLFKK